MKLVTFRSTAGEAPRFGALAGEDVVDLVAAAKARGTGEGPPPSLKAYIVRYGNELEPLRALLEWAEGQGAAPFRLARKSVVLLPPIPDPGKFFCVGKNNREHLEELRRTAMLHETPTEPTGFLKLNS